MYTNSDDMQSPTNQIKYIRLMQECANTKIPYPENSNYIKHENKW